MKSRRQLRVAEQIKRIVGEILGRGTKDPRIGFVSVMGVEISGDLKTARVFISIFGDQAEVQKTMLGLQSARSYIQRELGGQIHTRYTPLISFHLDRSISYGERIDRVINKLHREEGQLPQEEGSDENTAGNN